MAINRSFEAERLRTPMDEDDAVPFRDMAEYSFDDLLEQIAANKAKTFWCKQKDIKDVKDELDKRGVSYWTTLGSTGEEIRALNIIHDKRKKKGRGEAQSIRVKAIPCNAGIQSLKTTRRCR